jgi:hypothetical protein
MTKGINFGMLITAWITMRMNRRGTGVCTSSWPITCTTTLTEVTLSYPSKQDHGTSENQFGKLQVNNT